MPLPRRVMSLEDVPEVVRGEYQQEGNEFVLQVDGDEDVAGLKRITETLLKEKKKLQSDFKTLQEKIGDLDPEEARAAITRAKELEEKQLLDKGDFDKVSEKRLESQRLPLEAKIRELEATVKDRETATQELMTKLADTTRSGLLGKALIEAHVDPKWWEFVEMKAEKVWKWQAEDGVLVPMDGDSPLFVDGKQADMLSWITGALAKKQPDILLPSSGGNANGNTGRGASRSFVVTREIAQDINAVERLRAEAAKAGMPVQYES